MLKKKLAEKLKVIIMTKFFNNFLSNMKKIWCGIDSLLERNLSNEVNKIGPIKRYDELVKDDCEITNKLNYHFFFNCTTSRSANSSYKLHFKCEPEFNTVSSTSYKW